MTGVQLSEIICLRCDFCQFACPYTYDLPCIWGCEHEVGYDMYILGLDMLETGDNPLI